MKIEKTSLKDLTIIDQPLFEDDRGSFTEIYRKNNFEKIYKSDDLIQDNFSFSKKNVLRGMHYTIKPQSQLITILFGEIFEVFIDLRKNSSTFGKWEGFHLNPRLQKQIYMPHGFAHGFYVLSDNAGIHYKVSKYYERSNEYGLIWNDRTINIKWPCDKPIVSQRDSSFSSFNNLKFL